MRSVILTSAIVGALLLVASGTARADTLEVNVPFPFLVGNETFPAGQYLVEQGAFTGPSVLFIHGMNTPQAAFVLTESADGQGPNKPALQFEHRENQYRLTNVWETPREGKTIIPHS